MKNAVNWTEKQLAAMHRAHAAKKAAANRSLIPPNVGELKAAANAPVKKAQPEYKIQAAFVREMSVRYPSIMVFSDCAAHIKKTMIQQQRANALSTPGEKWPDVMIAQPSGEYCGLYLEFKAETPYKVDGVTLRKNEHNEAQAATMERLRAKGYACHFVWTVEMAMGIVGKYLNL